MVEDRTYPGDGRRKTSGSQHPDRTGQLPLEALRKPFNHAGKTENQPVLYAGGRTAPRGRLIGPYVQVDPGQLGRLTRKGA